jgi:hypothetical protein
MGEWIEFFLTKGKKGEAGEQKTSERRVFSFCGSLGWDRVKRSAFVPKNKLYLGARLLAVQRFPVTGQDRAGFVVHL